MSRLVIGRRDEAIQELESAMSLGTGSERAGTMLALLQLPVWPARGGVGDGKDPHRPRIGGRRRP